MVHRTDTKRSPEDQRPQHEGATASLFTSWYHEELQLLSKTLDGTLMKGIEEVVLRRKEKVGQDLSVLNTPQSKICDPKIQNPFEKCSLTVRLTNFEAAKVGKLQQASRQSSLPSPGAFIYSERTGKVTTVKLMKEDYSWLEDAGKVVCLPPSGKASKDEEHLRLQFKVLLDSFLRGHCYGVAQGVATPAWLLTRLFQCYCVAAGVPVAEVVDAVVAEYTEEYCSVRYKCGAVGGRPCVLGVGVYRDSPLHALWASQAVVVKERKTRAREAKSPFTRCVLVRPLEAMGAIRLFSTAAGGKATTAKFVARAVEQKLQRKYCCDLRQLNRMEFGHVMCKGNRGIKTVRPQARISRPQHRRPRQEYHYAGVALRAAPLQTRGDLGAAIHQRGFRLPRRQNLHLMRHAQLHAGYYGGDGSGEHHWGRGATERDAGLVSVTSP